MKIFCRKDKIKPILLNQILKIYNGKKSIEIKITKKMVGYKIGQFLIKNK